MSSDLPELPRAVDEKNSIDTENKTKKHSKPWFTLFIAWMALLFTAVGIAAGYKNWLRIHDKAKQNKADIEIIQTTVNNVPSKQQLEALRKELRQETDVLYDKTSNALAQTQKYAQQSQGYSETIQSQMAEITRIQAKVQQNAKPSTDKDWLLSEVEFLIRMASRKLHLDQDPKAAIAALKAADKSLLRLSSPHYLPVRQQISKDIVTLDNYPLANIGEISQQITAVMIQLEPLPANINDGQTVEKISLDVPKESTQAIAGNSLWADIKRQAYEGFNQAVVIQKHSKPIRNDLDADSRQQLYQLVQLRFETLRLLALQRQDKAYHQQIQLIIQTLQQYYPKERLATLLTTLQAWDKYQLSPEKPNILLSLEQLESALLTQPLSSNKDKK